MRGFPFYLQPNAMDCGPTCLKMVAQFYGKQYTLETLRNKSKISREGVSILGIAEAAEAIGFKTTGVKTSFDSLMKKAPLPAILHWNQDHFVVVLPQQLKNNRKSIRIADPAKDIYHLSQEDFLQHWISTHENGKQLGVALLLEPTAAFFEQEGEKEKKVSWRLLYRYLTPYRYLFLQLILGLIAGSLLQLVAPFLAQSIVDVGISTQDLSFIHIILMAQLALFFSRTVIEFIRSRILLHISTRINVSILSDFWIKLMRLPMSYFDTKMAGDTLQRLDDHKRIETFLTTSLLEATFSFFTLTVFSVVLFLYDHRVFSIFAAGSILYFAWVSLFMRYRRSLDFKRFAMASKENTATMQLIYGMQEIKLNNAEQLRRWEWEGLQAALFRLSFKSLSLNQYQQFGALFLNEGKNILITFFVAQSVVRGELTLGAMLAIQYMIGQLNAPVQQLIGFMLQAQDARISLERLNEISRLQDEEPEDKKLAKRLPAAKNIYLNNVSFTYPGAGNEPVLKNVNLSIPEGKVTAIVGLSGSGKTTLLKLLLRYYEDYTGEVRIGAIDPTSANQGAPAVFHLQQISARFWRNQCGCVMQDGFIFNDSIARNIAISEEEPDHEKLQHACRVANILDFIESLPLGFNTMIGAEGNGLSQGQKQRILIARAVYKDPEYIFFDEATNALDAENEKIILANLQQVFKGKTVIVVAHRLSTVKNADNIIVFHHGHIIEQGPHQVLTRQKGQYYQLVKNQLELGV